MLGKGSYRTGVEIPPVRWIIIELQMKQRELKDYASLHSLYTGGLGAGFDDDNDTGLRNMTFHRKLCLAVISTDLDKVSSSDDDPAIIEQFYHKHKDHGATYLYRSTKPDPTLPVYRDRASMAYYMCRNSSKSSYIAGLVEEICGANGRKVIIFCDWPSTAWLVEVLMLILGFNVLSIRAKYKQKKREEAVSAFNDKDCPIPVLVTSVEVSATAINLQRDCADVIFTDVPSNAQSTQQAAGRVIRIGQDSACNI